MRVLVSGKRVMAPDSRNVLRGEQTRRRILDAARARILASGFEAMRLDDLAADAGVTKAAVIKSTGGKSAILLALGEEDRQTRLEVIRAALKQRTGLRRRVTDVVARLLELDTPRLNVVVAYVGYMWFWSGADHERSHSMVEETRALLCQLLAAASPEPLSPARLDTLSMRLVSAYAVGVRDLHYRNRPHDATVRRIVEMTLD